MFYFSLAGPFFEWPHHLLEQSLYSFLACLFLTLTLFLTLCAPGKLTAVPLTVCQAAHWTDNTNLMYVRGCLWAWKCALGVLCCVCGCMSGSFTYYKCLSCPLLCAHSPKHPLLHLQSGPQATILTAEAGREGRLKHHTHMRARAADGRMWPLSQWHLF